MVLPRTSNNTKKSRSFVVVVILLWVIALAAIAFLVWYWQSGGFALATTTTTLAPTTTTSGPSTTTTEEPTTTTTTIPPALTVSAGGDVMGDRKVGKFIDENGGAAVFEGVKPLLEASQLAFINLEGSISDTGNRIMSKEYTFRARPGLLDGLTSAGIDVVSLANNHSLDYRWAALSDCIARLDAAGVKHAGAGSNASEASAATIVETPSGKVAVIAISEIMSSFAATSTRSGINFVSPSNLKHTAILAKVTEASQQADFVIVSVHWGTEYKINANSHQQSFAHALIDAGADLILGHHPHVVQGLEVYNNRLIVYSMGDFVFDHYSRLTGEAFVLQVSIPRDGTAPWGTITPVYLSDSHGIPAVVTGTPAKRIIDRMVSLSAKRGLQLTVDGDVATFGTPQTEGAGTATSESTTTTPGSTTTTSAPGASTTVTTP